MEGFTIKCNKCGKEKQLIINSKPEFRKGSIDVYSPPSYGDENIVQIECECGNEAYDN